MRGLDPRIHLLEESFIDGLPGDRRADATPSFRRLCPAMTSLEPMPARLFLSSGDLVADRRFEFARDLQLKGDLAAAADLLMQAIELAPKFISPWYTIGEILTPLGPAAEAIEA